MATREIDETEFLQNQKLRETVATLMKHPKAKLLVQQAQKLVDPNAVTPDLDAQAPIEELRGSLTKELEALKKEREEEKLEAQKKQMLAELNAKLDGGFKKLREAGWTDDGIKGVRELMEAKGITDPEDAAAIFEKQHPPQTPVVPTAGSGSWGFIEETQAGADEMLKRLVSSKGESEGVTDAMVRDILKDVRGPSRR